MMMLLNQSDALADDRFLRSCNSLRNNDDLFNKPKPLHKPMGKDNDIYKNKRNVYATKLM